MNSLLNSYWLAINDAQSEHSASRAQFNIRGCHTVHHVPWCAPRNSRKTAVITNECWLGLAKFCQVELSVRRFFSLRSARADLAVLQRRAWGSKVWLYFARGLSALLDFGAGDCTGEPRSCWWPSVWWPSKWLHCWPWCPAHQRLCEQSVCIDLSPGICHVCNVVWSLFLQLKFVETDFKLHCRHCLQCFDAVGWAAGRASGL